MTPEDLTDPRVGMAAIRDNVLAASRAADIVLPAEYDHDFYVTHPENGPLHGVAPDIAWAHWVHYGQHEGRACNPIEGRGPFLGLLPAGSSILEIGPGSSPVFRRPADNVRYLDAMDTDALRKVWGEIHKADPALVPEIDYVWHGQPYQEIIADRFDLAFSSHAVEHQPCLIRHFNDVADVLRPGGRYFLVIPDKRFCFDHFLPESTLGEVMEAHAERRTRHSLRNILDHHLLTTHNDSALHWDNNHGADPRHAGGEAALAARLREHLATPPSTDYVDTHAWRFTPATFRYLTQVLREAGLSRLALERVYPTVRPSFEFYAVLKRVE